MRSTMLVAIALALAACGGDRTEQVQNDRDIDHDHNAERSQPEMRATDDSENVGDEDVDVRGVVAVVGNEPGTQVVLSVGAGDHVTQIALVGELRDELGRLSGVEVSVLGVDIANPQGIPEHAIDVFDYDVISVNSVPAYLGVLDDRDGDMWLERDEALRLTAVPGRLQNMAGAKVWIAGPVDGNELRVQSYGVLRER